MKSKSSVEGMVNKTFIFFLAVVKNTASTPISHIIIASTDLNLFVAGALNYNAITITPFTSNIKC